MSGQCCRHLSTNERQPRELSLAGLVASGGFWQSRPMTQVACRQEGVGAPARRRRSSGIQSREPHETLLTGQFLENERRRGRHSGIQSQHDEGLTDPQMHGVTEKQGEIVTY